MLFLCRLIGGRIGSARERVFQAGFDTLQANLNASQPFVHIRHLPVQTAKRGKYRYQQGAVDESVFRGVDHIIRHNG